MRHSELESLEALLDLTVWIPTLPSLLLEVPWSMCAMESSTAFGTLSLGCWLQIRLHCWWCWTHLSISLHRPVLLFRFYISMYPSRHCCFPGFHGIRKLPGCFSCTPSHDLQHSSWLSTVMMWREGRLCTLYRASWLSRVTVSVAVLPFPVLLTRHFHWLSR